MHERANECVRERTNDANARTDGRRATRAMDDAVDGKTSRAKRRETDDAANGARATQALRAGVAVDTVRKGKRTRAKTTRRENDATRARKREKID